MEGAKSGGGGGQGQKVKKFFRSQPRSDRKKVNKHPRTQEANDKSNPSRKRKFDETESTSSSNNNENNGGSAERPFKRSKFDNNNKKPFSKKPFNKGNFKGKNNNWKGEKQDQKPDSEKTIDDAVKSRNVIEFNKLISSYGQTKKFNMAKDAFDTMLRVGVKPTVYSYTNLINACVRCGELDLAQSYFNQMPSKKVVPNEVTYTALLKGLCQEGKIEDAYQLLQDMKFNEAVPNLRTYNTFLRGCMRNGDAVHASKVWAEMKEAKISADVTTYENLIKTYCEVLDTKAASQIARELEQKKLSSIVAYGSLATAHALRGEYDEASDAVGKAEQSIKEGQIEDTKIKEASVLLLRRLTREEVRNETLRVRQYLDSLVASGAYVPNSKHSKQNQNQQQEEEVEGFVDLNADPNDERQKNKNNQKKKQQEKQQQKQQQISSKVFPNVENALFFANHSSVKKTTHAQPLNLASLFPKNPNGPVKLEICSGMGDFLLEKAKEEPKTNWLGIEMRFDRVYQTYTKLKLESIENVRMLCGDANEIVGKFLAQHSLVDIFINFPDPPPWDGSKQQLITVDFLERLHGLLSERGTLSILTDHRSYSAMISEKFTLCTHLFYSRHAPDFFTSQIPEKYPTSYFDRFWKNGNYHQRFFFEASAKPTLASLTEKSTTTTKATPAQTTTSTTTKKNEDVKMDEAPTKKQEQKAKPATNNNNKNQNNNTNNANKKTETKPNNNKSTTPTKAAPKKEESSSSSDSD